MRGIPVVKTFAQSVESFDRFYSLIVKLKDFVVRWSMGVKNKMSLYEAISSSTAFFLVDVYKRQLQEEMEQWLDQCGQSVSSFNGLGYAWLGQVFRYRE